MSENITELLRKQAAYIKQKGDMLSAAEKLQLAAKELIEQANAKPVISERVLLKATKEDKLKTREEKIRAGFRSDLDSSMKSYGWDLFHNNDKLGTRSYGRKDMPDYKVQYKSGAFSIIYKGDVQVSGIHLKDPHTMKFINPGKFIKAEIK